MPQDHRASEGAKQDAEARALSQGPGGTGKKPGLGPLQDGKLRLRAETDPPKFRNLTREVRPPSPASMPGSHAGHPSLSNTCWTHEGGNLSAPDVLLIPTHLVLPLAPYWPNPSDGETEAQGGEATCSSWPRAYNTYVKNLLHRPLQTAGGGGGQLPPEADLDTSGGPGGRCTWEKSMLILTTQDKPPVPSPRPFPSTLSFYLLGNLLIAVTHFGIWKDWRATEQECSPGGRRRGAKPTATGHTAPWTPGRPVHAAQPLHHPRWPLSPPPLPPGPAGGAENLALKQACPRLTATPRGP